MGEFKMEIENIVNVEIDAKHNLKMYLTYKEEDYIQRTIWRTKKPYEFDMGALIRLLGSLVYRFTVFTTQKIRTSQ